MAWSRIAFYEHPQLSEPTDGIFLEASRYRGIGAGVPEDPFMCLHYRFETEDGEWSTRLFRGVPDAVVRELRVDRIPVAVDVNDPLPDVDDPDTAWLDIYRGWLTVCRDFTIKARAVKNAPTPRWYVWPWSNVVFRKAANRKTGRDFLWVSWESAKVKPPTAPGRDPPMAAAPIYHPCGAIVGVLRSDYARCAKWYTDGPLGRIRYYFVPKTNAILPYRTRYWPYSQDLQIKNTATSCEAGGPLPGAAYPDTGEHTPDRREWIRGDDYLGRDGSSPHGTAQDFAGESPLPWPCFFPTPLELIPQCVQVVGAGNFEFDVTIPEAIGGMDREVDPTMPTLIGGADLDVEPTMPAMIGAEDGGTVAPTMPFMIGAVG